MKREIEDYKNDMLESVSDAIDFSQNITYDDFVRDRKTSNAVVRSLEILGEAAKYIPENVRADTPGIPWKRVAGLRDVLAHEYFGID